MVDDVPVRNNDISAIELRPKKSPSNAQRSEKKINEGRNETETRKREQKIKNKTQNLYQKPTQQIDTNSYSHC